MLLTPISPADRLFSPDSLFWQINRESLMVLSGPRALLLELAHPLVAQGVADHSNFRARPLGRLFRTVGVMTALNFEPRAQAGAAVKHTRVCHARVRGALPHDVGPYLAGTPYRGDDPLLQLWVLATLLDSVLVAYAHLVRPLTEAEKHAYYAVGRRLGRAFGIPADLLPPTYADFECYVAAMLDSDALTVGPAARAVVQALFAPVLLGPAIRLSSFISLGLTPPRLRAAFGLPWSAAHERRFQQLGALSRRLRPFTPDPLCVHPQALLAEWRLRRASPN
ncbi:MAG: DUF2236 domain-containing protein [Anaerolineales bacterium]|nr:DUF2236 domain-containing protein [Anaerolineales bacterium]